MKDRIYDFMVDFGLEKGYLPTYREIGEGVGLKSTSSVAYHITKLVSQGLIEPISEKRYRVKGLGYRYDSNSTKN